MSDQGTPKLPPVHDAWGDPIPLDHHVELMRTIDPEKWAEMFDQHCGGSEGMAGWFAAAIEAGRRSLFTEAADFLELFEHVFEHDWDHSAHALNDESRPFFIAQGGTFLNPGVDDESSDWANRGALLEGYRDLKAALDQEKRHED